MQGQLTNATDADRYVNAGNATVTLRSVRTGKHLTYRIRRFGAGKRVTGVSLLTGPSNESDFTYIGLWEANRLRLTAKSRLTDDSEPVKALRYFAAGLDRNVIAPDLEVFHEGRCGRCNRLLTVPTSIANGIGPECARKVFN